MLGVPRGERLREHRIDYGDGMLGGSVLRGSRRYGGVRGLRCGVLLEPWSVSLYRMRRRASAG